MTKCIKRIRDLFEYALYKFTLYLLTDLLSLLSGFVVLSFNVTPHKTKSDKLAIHLIAAIFLQSLHENC